MQTHCAHGHHRGVLRLGLRGRGGRQGRLVHVQVLHGHHQGRLVRLAADTVGSQMLEVLQELLLLVLLGCLFRLP